MLKQVLKLSRIAAEGGIGIFVLVLLIVDPFKDSILNILLAICSTGLVIGLVGDVYHLIRPRRTSKTEALG